ncbi:5'-nucleotidase [Streptococcus pyogenes]|nr:5'-nucleotidase [Streptococcus pyogenes]SQH47862.1 5'-nucleotidase [Streptococcus pyogenes]VGS56406.1 5'-nucleotidase [Streptococcus pyogenes]VGT19211.1 5'-nucleotidase [Streptococcus pyogenes]VGT22782.1 5'-nucleotidase [Streptococcus pyogenes]
MKKYFILKSSVLSILTSFTLLVTDVQADQVDV